MRLKLLLALGLTAFSLNAQPVPRGSFVEHLRFLSSDELRGRGNDRSELLEAAHYISDQFERLGLIPVGEGGTYLQPFSVTTAVEMGDRSLCTFYNLFGVPVSLTHGSDYISYGFGEKNIVNAPLAFAGFGISAPEFNYDDYGEIDVRGKAVVVFEHEPGEHKVDSPFNGLNPTEYSSLLSKVEAARDHGAAALILIPDHFNHRASEEVESSQRLQSVGIPVIRLSRVWAQHFWQASPRDARDVWNWIDRRMTPASFDLPTSFVHLQLDIRRTRHIVNNVVGFLPGESNDFILIGAHYDHLGMGGAASLEVFEEAAIHNGADDNASGVAAVLQVAEDFSSQNHHFGILFVAFAAEELGLLGSNHYTEEPLLPLENTVCMLNFDMVGRSDGELLIGGVGTSPDFEPILRKLAPGMPLKLRLAATTGGSSDHLPFSRQGIPVLFFFSGLHPDYHRPSDDFEKLNLVGMQEIIDFADDLVLSLQRLPAVRHSDLAAAAEAASQRRKRYATFGPLLGGLSDTGFDGPGVRFKAILKDSPAEVVGIRPGDILVRFEGVPITSNYDFIRELRAYRPGDSVKVVVTRNQIKREFQVTLSSR